VTGRRELVEKLFLREDNLYGCAETALLALKICFGLPEPENSNPAMALNGGVGYSGGICGALSGAAMALGELAGLRLPDHQKAKRAARLLLIDTMTAFSGRFGSPDCRNLVPYDLSVPSEHDRFLREGLWKTTCLEQILYSVEHLAPLAEPALWASRMKELSI